ncbi:adenylate cyclase [Sphaeroforma arctica JP610]|uniref:Adenylate cyclase n=1 Tax=Sphaeroforma arctica JP610 TaxID=667725 RepID=A0A0L0G3W2_9EUKA|nr:adenylate cyclase [Sphaeroforma arctica JP610]KNC82908.1 adenylate cyclase [Sphaeroforma arctica JP610]|eukprot:XP_014156810.1 adenylate cyclase [Sphaeroforma arctica JP610]
MNLLRVVSRKLSNMSKNVEIERKYLVKSGWEKLVTESHIIRQGYLTQDRARTVRVRRKDDTGFLTIKGISVGATRSEFEYAIPASDADDMLETLCFRPFVDKVRHIYPDKENNVVWEIDEFKGENSGLIVAEVELESEDYKLTLPDFVVKEVTGDVRYYNSQLSDHPYCNWSNEEKNAE